MYFFLNIKCVRSLLCCLVVVPVFECVRARSVSVFEREAREFLVIFHEWVIQLTFEFECAFSYYALESHEYVNDENIRFSHFALELRTHMEML